MQTTLVTEHPEKNKPSVAFPGVCRILVLRTATRMFSATLQKLKNEFPDSHITVMAPSSCHASLNEDPSVDDILTAPEIGRWSLSNPGPGGTQVLKDGNFDLAVALYNEPQGQGYSNIDALVAVTGARELRGYAPDLNFIPITPTSIRKKSNKERMTWFWFMANVLTSITILIVVTLAMTGETLLRKLRGLWSTS